MRLGTSWAKAMLELEPALSHEDTGGWDQVFSGLKTAFKGTRRWHIERLEVWKDTRIK